MCCLTIVKTYNKNIVITHNRDEQWSRQTHGARIREHSANGKIIYMPKDSLSEGTWIGTDGTKAAAILNGFKANHIKKDKYRASRGTIIPQFLLADTAHTFISSFDPTGLEPFTLVMVEDDKSFVEYGWDEKDIHLVYHSLDAPAIYSSATLYTYEIQENRRNLFHTFVLSDFNSEDLWQLHKKKGHNHNEFFNVDYNAEISTVAISQIVLGESPIFHYKSLLNQNQKQSILLLKNHNHGYF